MAGWIKLHKKMKNWEWYTDHNTLILFIHILLTAEYEDTRFRGYDIPRGAMVTGLKALSKDTGLSIQSIRTSIIKLKSTGEITVKSTNKFSIITVCNFNEYQKQDCHDQQANQQASQQTTNKRLTTSKEYKKLKKEEYSEAEKRFLAFWEKYPRKSDKKKALAAWIKNKCYNGSFEQIMTALEQQKKSQQWQDAQYIPHPTTWINGRRWEDEILIPQGQYGEIKCDKCFNNDRGTCDHKTNLERSTCKTFAPK